MLNCKRIALILSTLFVIVVLYAHHNGKFDTLSLVREKDTFSLAIAKNLSRCLNHPVGPLSPYNDWKMSDTYARLSPEFFQYIAANVKGEVEGNTGQHINNTRFMHYMAQTPFIKTVCETGFNLGHSSFNWLTASPQITVYSFDLGSHAYAHVMAKKLKEMFPGRLHVTFGNSIQTVAKFIKDNPNFKCDLMFVDGGHYYDVATADLKNFISVASKPLNFVLFDDHPNKFSAPYGKAWNDAVTERKVVEYFNCLYADVRAFSFGRVL